MVTLTSYFSSSYSRGLGSSRDEGHMMRLPSNIATPIIDW
jgi:hypothetical protein